METDQAGFLVPLQGIEQCFIQQSRALLRVMLGLYPPQSRRELRLIERFDVEITVLPDDLGEYG